MTSNWANESHAIFDKNVLPELIQGLFCQEKYIESRFFYDKIGSEIFDRITRLPEYYLTSAESEILTENIRKIADMFDTQQELTIAELGAGDARKVNIILSEFSRRGHTINYLPVDVSPSAIARTCQEVAAIFPSVNIHPFTGQFDDGLSFIRNQNSGQMLVMFLGSSIGNFDTLSARAILQKISRSMKRNDFGLIGFDLVKSPSILMPAYADSTGVTKAFNLNLLARMIRELEADINLTDFQHFSFYDPRSKSMESFLLSTKDQKISFPKLNLAVEIRQNEAIHTETSSKYETSQIISELARCHLETVELMRDKREWFADTLVRISP
jgi:dimethylhistidine N-methyltransferase